MAAQHPEVASELELIERDLERFDELQRVEPPAGTLHKIMGTLSIATPVEGQPDEISKGFNWAPWVAFGIMALIGGYFFGKGLQKQHSIDELNTQLTALKEDCATIDSLNSNLKTQLSVFQNTDAQLVALAGSSLSPESAARVLYNPEKQKSFLTAVDLPTPPPGKQYQLWALVDGAPVDMGVFELAPLGDSLLEVPHILGVGAFAITLEDSGGRPTPNLDQLYLIGNVG